MKKPISGLPSGLQSIKVLGTRIHMVKVSEVVSLMADWIGDKEPCRYIVNTGMHGVMEGCRDPEFKKILNSADLFTPDGYSVVWLGRRHGYSLEKRVTGVDLVLAFLRMSEEQGFSNFFYGDTPETLGRLEVKLKEDFPRLKVAGLRSPPFRLLTPEEAEGEIQLINRSGADVIWVGLGLPKQETWMFQNRSNLNASITVGVGASFKFIGGSVTRAPTWVGDNGLEWIWRLVHEPRRIWRRALLDVPRFMIYLTLERLGLKSFAGSE